MDYDYDNLLQSYTPEPFPPPAHMTCAPTPAVSPCVPPTPPVPLAQAPPTRARPTSTVSSGPTSTVTGAPLASTIPSRFPHLPSPHPSLPSKPPLPPPHPKLIAQQEQWRHKSTRIHKPSSKRRSRLSSSGS
ncbi:hypothetical protein OH77DRAFT_1526258 [Trametes cingulata]|nr:hypothetical protein OH77DRAFT_1526258 [Trametes cingulata]